MGFWLVMAHREHRRAAASCSQLTSAATAVAIGFVAGGTRTIRVGAGGVMLPNHAPLVIAEQFGTLESLYPGRIDLGLGRAPPQVRPPAASLAAGIRFAAKGATQDP
jgi:alkanesulfonate monooxygenase SsuD/methylene tetrahydromethanopterin reductase-like flavin-dependent oxidoreductase (luciferase family)